MLEINLLGSEPTIWRDGELVSSKSLKTQALLLYVFLSGEEVYRREYLASLLWEERNRSLAQDNLRQALARIKRTCGNLAPALRIERSHLVVDRSSVQIDVQTLLDSMAQTPQKLDAATLRQDFQSLFAGFEDVSDGFASWVRVYRNEFEQRAQDALKVTLASGATAETKDTAARLLLKIDPTDEEAVRFRMRRFAEAGQQAEALKAYNTLYELLDTQYDVEPAAETIELNAAIKLGEVSAPGPALAPVAASQPIRHPPFIFVADFFIDRSDPLTERMGNFFRTDVLGNLSKFREWNVVDIEPLQTDYYRLDCQIDQHEADIAAILTLYSYPDRRIVWSERFVTGFENWRKTQWKIAQQLALAINQSLTIDRIRACSAKQIAQRTVFDKWAICHNLNLEWSPLASSEVIATLEDILETAPDFNLAHSYLAEMHNKMHLVYPGIFRSETSVQKAVKHAKIALNLDQLDCHAHRVYAWARTLNGDYEIGEFHFNQAYSLNPSNLYVTTSCALGFAYLDNLTKACAIADDICKAPVPLQGFQWGYVQNIYYLAGRLEDAKTAGELAGDSISNLPAWQAVIHADLGQPDAARSCMEKFFAATLDRWHGDQSASREAVVEWLLHCFPMKNAHKRSALFDNMLSI